MSNIKHQLEAVLDATLDNVEAMAVFDDVEVDEDELTDTDAAPVKKEKKKSTKKITVGATPAEWAEMIKLCSEGVSIDEIAQQLTEKAGTPRTVTQVTNKLKEALKMAKEYFAEFSTDEKPVNIIEISTKEMYADFIKSDDFNEEEKTQLLNAWNTYWVKLVAVHPKKGGGKKVKVNPHDLFASVMSK